MTDILKDKIKEQAREKKTLKCGCQMEAEVITATNDSKYHKSQIDIKRWTLKAPCENHRANYAKKADRMIRREESMKKRARIQEMELKKRVKYRRFRRGLNK